MGDGLMCKLSEEGTEVLQSVAAIPSAGEFCPTAAAIGGAQTPAEAFAALSDEQKKKMIQKAMDDAKKMCEDAKADLKRAKLGDKDAQARVKDRFNLDPSDPNYAAKIDRLTANFDKIEKAIDDTTYLYNGGHLNGKDVGIFAAIDRPSREWMGSLHGHDTMTALNEDGKSGAKTNTANNTTGLPNRFFDPTVSDDEERGRILIHEGVHRDNSFDVSPQLREDGGDEVYRNSKPNNPRPDEGNFKLESGIPDNYQNYALDVHRR